jgi:TPR repeat protein
MRMGERYRNGEGVPKDLKKARDYLVKAATAGESKAQEELANLPSK